MRALIHPALFALALTAVGQASADDGGRRRERRTTIVIAPQTHHPSARPVRAPVDPMPPRYDYRRARSQRSQGILEARREFYNQQRDHDEIVRIADRWTRAMRYRDPHAQRNEERRAYAWIQREIQESSGRPDNGRYVHRLHALRRQLLVAYPGHGYGRRGHRFDAHKAQVFVELVELSERQVQHARARAREQMHMAFAYR
ncbi:MAG: hypothetical protein WBN38_12955 [Polyangiales bacterium]